MRAATHALFEALGITYVAPSQQRGRLPLTTCCGPFIDRLIARHGVPHVSLVLKTIVETDGNSGELIADVIDAISDIVLLHPRWAELGGAWLQAFDQIDLAKVRRIAKASRVRPLKSAIAAVLHLKLQEILGPSAPKPEKPAKPAREPKPSYRRALVEQRLALGRELMALRQQARSNQAYGRLRRRHFPDLEQKHADAALRIGRRYADRSEITGKADWAVLCALASRRLSETARQRFEQRIAAGERVLAGEIRRARRLRPAAVEERAAARGGISSRHRPRYTKFVAIVGLTSSQSARPCHDTDGTPP
jgi:hypothetical protein